MQQPAQPCLRGPNLFTFSPWNDTLLGTIHRDLHPRIHFYLQGLGKPELKNDEYVFKLTIGSTVPAKGKCSHPCGVAVSPRNGNIYVADTSARCIQVFWPYGGHIKTFGTAGSGPGEFSEPETLIFDAGGNAIIVDSHNHRLQVIDIDEEKFIRQIGKYGKKDGELKNPLGLTLDNSGNIVVSEIDNHRISVFTPKGDWLMGFGGKGDAPGCLCEPVGVAVDSQDNFLVCDSRNKRVQMFSPRGEHLRMIEPDGIDEFKSPWGITLDRVGRIVVVDERRHVVSILTSDGQVCIQEFGKYGTNDGEMSSPRSPCIDQFGNILFVDCNGHRVHVFGPKSEPLPECYVKKKEKRRKLAVRRRTKHKDVSEGRRDKK